MPTKLIFCEPLTLTVATSNCNKTIQIAEESVCPLMIGANYNLYINGILDPGSPYTADGNGLLFPGGLTVNRTFPITNIRLEFECDQCQDCTIEEDLPPVNSPCECSALQLTSVFTADCTTGLTYTISNGTGKYRISIKKGTTEVHSIIRYAAGTYNVPGPIGNGTYTLTVVDDFGCTSVKAINVANCCAVTVSNLQYDCNTKILSGTITSANGSGNHVVEVIGNLAFNKPTGNFTEGLDLTDGIYTVKVTDSADALCYNEKTVAVNCGELDLTIESVCNGTNSGIKISNPSGGTGPYYAELYVNSAVDANNCPTGSIYDTISPIPVAGAISANSGWSSSTVIHVVLVDALGRKTCFPGQLMLNCAINNFDFTTEFKCVGLNKQICVTPNAAGTYNITIGGGLPFSDTFSVGQQKCYNTAIANGSYVVSMEKGGNTVNKTVVVTDCFAYTTSYDCTTGLSIFENGSPWVGKIRVDGTPNPSFWNYLGPNTVYLADTTPNHVVNLYTAGGSLITSITITGINCCQIGLTNVTPVCNIGDSDGYIEFDIVNVINPLGTHNVKILDNSSNVVDSDPNFVGTHYVSASLGNGLYTIQVVDNTYNIPNIGIGSSFICQATASAELNCISCTIGINSSLTNAVRCPVIADPTRLKIDILNTNAYSVNYELYRNDVTAPGPCLVTSDPPPGSLVASGTLNVAGAACHDFANNAAGDIPCFYVKFVKVSDPTCKTTELVVINN